MVEDILKRATDCLRATILVLDIHDDYHHHSYDTCHLHHCPTDQQFFEREQYDTVTFHIGKEHHNHDNDQDYDHNHHDEFAAAGMPNVASVVGMRHPTGTEPT